jgi:hypothetical protein
MKSAQLKVWPFVPGLGVVLGLAGQGAGAAADTFLQVYDHSVLFCIYHFPLS